MGIFLHDMQRIGEEFPYLVGDACYPLVCFHRDSKEIVSHGASYCRKLLQCACKIA